MGKFTLYNVPLKRLEPGIHQYSYQLNDCFFTDIDQDAIRKGDVQVALSVSSRGDDFFEMEFQLEGEIQIPCDRCLDNMSLPVSVQEHLYVKLGEQYSEESDDTVIIPETEGEINIAWFLYEFIALTIPLKHVHPAGMCNKTMAGKLRKHLTHRVDEADEFDEETFEETDVESETDPRWDTLKNLIIEENNNN